MICKWIKSGTGLFTSMAAGSEGARYHLIVERVPGRDWDWVIWRAGLSPTARYGHAASAKACMAAAESATEKVVCGRAIPMTQTKSGKAKPREAKNQTILHKSRKQGIRPASAEALCFQAEHFSPTPNPQRSR